MLAWIAFKNGLNMTFYKYFSLITFRTILLLYILLNISLLSAKSVSPEQLKQLISKANKGEKRAQYKLGLSYMSGNAVNYNPRKAVHWFKKSATQNYYQSWYRLGEMYFDKVYGMQNYRTSFKWLFKPALHNHSISQYKIALLYFEGKGVAQNNEKALIWATRAKNNNIVRASALLYQIERKIARMAIKSRRRIAARQKSLKKHSISAASSAKTIPSSASTATRVRTPSKILSFASVLSLGK